MRIRRSVLFAPADREERARRCLTGAADVAVLDLEDGVAPDRKKEAREISRRLFAELREAPGPERAIRINAPGSPEHPADMALVARVRPGAVVLPKAEDPRRVRALASRLPKGTALHLILETGLGVLNARDLARASPRVASLAFGAEDLAADIGARRTPSSFEVLYARSHVALVAGTFRLPSIDQVFVNYRDPGGLRREAEEARNLGYRGKLCIHPDQVPVVHSVFTPSAEEVERARRLVEAAARAGGGAFALDGRMVDRPLVEQAREVLEAARQAESRAASGGASPGR
ncbi:MAG: CoA ester lyase [Halobacteria archaeon]